MISINGLLRKNRSVISFGLIGCMNTAVDYAMYSLFLAYSPLGLAAAQVLGYVCGLINSFIMNRLITFKNGTTTSIGIQVPRFIVVNAITLGVSIICLSGLVHGLEMNPYLAKIPVTVVIMIINYLGYKKFVFKVKEQG